MKDLKYRLATLLEVQAALVEAEPVAFDIETDVKEGFYSTILLAQFKQKHWDEALLVPLPDLFQLLSILKPLHIVCHNTSYEVSTLQQQLGAVLGQRTALWLPADWDDTLLLSKLRFYTREKYSLDYCYKYAFKVDPYDMHGLNKKEMQTTDWSVLTEDKMKYAAIDVFYLLELREACAGWLDHSCYQLDKSATSLAFEFQTAGLPVNFVRLEEMRKANLAKIAELAVPINVNSWQQVRPYIGEDESDGLALATFALQGNDKARDVQAARKLLKQNSFLTKFVDESYEGRIYGKFTFTTKSGRGNCKDQNLQQLPRKTKGLFEAGEGKVFVISDFAQLELRMIGAITGDPTMEKLFKEALDLHQYTADAMNVPRQQSKTCNFNLTYGGSANMLRSIFIKDADMLLAIEKVRALKRDWHALYKVLTEWQDQMTSDWREGLPQATVLGRKFISKLYTDAMNLPVQGTSADVAKLAMHKMFKAIRADEALSEVCKLCNFVHDNFMWECPDDPTIYEPLAAIVATSMQEAWQEIVKFTKVPDMPMPVDVLVGKNWGDLENEKETPVFKLVKE